MMAEALDDDDDIFVYMGGNQQVPDEVRRARIHISVKIIRARAFYNRRNLISVEFHDGVEIIEHRAFKCCRLQSIKLLGVKIIKQKAFSNCTRLTAVEFGNKLETIEQQAFIGTGLRKLRMPSVTTVERWAFAHCDELSDVEFGEELRKLQEAFHRCNNLERIALPLKGDMIEGFVFTTRKLETVDLVGGFHQTIGTLHLESWRNEMMDEINRINPLPTITAVGKTQVIRQWMERVIRQLDHYKAEHQQILKEATTLLELALWKANLDVKEGRLMGEGVRTVGKVESSRDEIRYTSGADIVIKNVLPFLALK